MTKVRLRKRVCEKIRRKQDSHDDSRAPGVRVRVGGYDSGHRVSVDRPADKGGTDVGPMGGELFLAAIGGCFMSNLLAAIRARDAKVSNVHATVDGTIEGTPARFTSVEVCVAADCTERDLLEKLVEIAERGCIMMNTLRGTLDVRVRIAAHA